MYVNLPYYIICDRQHESIVMDNVPEIAHKCSTHEVDNGCPLRAFFVDIELATNCKGKMSTKLNNCLPFSFSCTQSNYSF